MIWRVSYTPPSVAREKAYHFKDKAFALRLAADYRALGWLPVYVERVSAARARADLKFDPWAEPLKVDPTMPLKRGRARKRQVAEYLATPSGGVDK